MVLKAHTIDVMLVDIEMDGDDGLKFVAMVRGSPEPKVANITTLIVSSHATEARVMEAGVVGADGFLSKPFTVGGFAKRLTEGLAARRSLTDMPPQAATRTPTLSQIEL